MFSYRLKQLREDLGITQDELAKMLNLTQSTIAYYESGRKMPTLENAIVITKIFNTSLDYLVGISNCQTFENIKENRISYYANKLFLDDINQLSADSLKELENFIRYLKFKDSNE
ncbi:MAG TPA: helix-turn-helix transcriptional regulator [Clostridia bacterium]|nr:helix-turn-helix transcriptional regulator [Clostridia bacterium]